jgi:hypothetical protein
MAAGVESYCRGPVAYVMTSGGAKEEKGKSFTIRIPVR